MNYRKLLYLLILTMVFILSGCTNDPGKIDRITPPIFTKVLINKTHQWGVVNSANNFYKKNEMLRLTVYLINPDDATISSITINGTNYKNTTFEEQSSNRTIRIPVDTGALVGERTFNIDQIKYEDVNELKNVKMKGVSNISVHIKKKAPTLSDVDFSNVYYDNDQTLQITLTFDNEDEAEIISITINEVHYTELMINQENSKITLELKVSEIENWESVTIKDITFNDLYNIEIVDLNYEFDTNVM